VKTNGNFGALFMGVGIFLGLATLGLLISNAVLTFKSFERTVTVKGLSEKEFQADIVIWPIQFTDASNNLEELYKNVEASTASIQLFLADNGLSENDISFSSPAVTDKSAQQWGGGAPAEFRYSAIQTVTVYSDNIDAVRAVMGKLSELGKQGIVFMGSNYGNN